MGAGSSASASSASALSHAQHLLGESSTQKDQLQSGGTDSPLLKTLLAHHYDDAFTLLRVCYVVNDRNNY